VSIEKISKHYYRPDGELYALAEKKQVHFKQPNISFSCWITLEGNRAVLFVCVSENNLNN
jgi:hypothetical protein